MFSLNQKNAVFDVLQNVLLANCGISAFLFLHSLCPLNDSAVACFHDFTHDISIDLLKEISQINFIN